MEYKNITVAYCNDVTLFAKLLLDLKCVDSKNQLLKIAVDRGSGFIKFCLNIVNLNEIFENYGKVEIDYLKIKPITACRSLCKDGLKKTFKDSSVNASFLLLVAPEIPERYLNIKILFEKLNLEKVEHLWYAT